MDNQVFTKLYKFIMQDRGITLVELIIVVALIGVIMVGVYNFLFFADSVFTRRTAESAALQEFNVAVMNIRDDVRSAYFPIEDTNPVEIKDEGERLNIYHTDDNYTKISYKLSDDNDTLERGVTDESDVDDVDDFGKIDDWESIVKDVYIKEGDKLFKDKTKHEAGGRRMVELNLNIEVPGVGLVTVDEASYGAEVSYMSRSHEAGAEADYEIPLEDVSINYDEYTLTIPDHENVRLIKIPEPYNTTDIEEVEWSSEDDDVASVDDEGYVTAEEEGETNIKVEVTTENGETMDDYCKIHVEEEEDTGC